ncbi:MAG: rRNA maturation RNase YbeY [Woeseia sp.]
MGSLQRWPLAVVEYLDLRFERDREITVRLVDRAESRHLNSRYRHRDAETNVLSFPAGEPFELPPEEALPLGDLVLCAPLVAEEAASQRKSSADHWAHLLVHGTLHLLGYDHEADADAASMEALEVAILARHGVANPYMERESGR